MKFTVKVISALSVLTLAIIAASLITQSYLNRTSIRLEQSINNIEKGINAGDWNTVGSNLDNSERDWMQAKKIWAMLIDHEEIDNIDETMHRMKEYVNTKEVPSALAEASVLKLYLRHIPVKEGLNIENIL